MPTTSRDNDLLAIVDAAHRARAAGGVEKKENDDHGNVIISFASADGTVLLEKQAIIGGWNIVYLLPGGGYRTTTRGPFAEDPAPDEWIDTAWAEVTRIVTGTAR